MGNNNSSTAARSKGDFSPSKDEKFPPNYSSYYYRKSSCPEVELEVASINDISKTGEDLEEAAEDDASVEGEGLIASTSQPTLRPIKLKVFHSEDLKNEKLIGEGSFGKVLEGTLQGKRVAIKMFHIPPSSPQTAKEFARLTKLHHRNIVPVLGILSETAGSLTGNAKVLMQLFPEGNLLQYFSKKENPQDYAMLGKLALDVIHGVEYLHRYVVHGNLAARNILVEKSVSKIKTHYNAKVSDFGIIQLAEPTGGNFVKNKTGKMVPIRWAPKELIAEDGTATDFTTNSDVWGFGVLLWEMWTKGDIPYGFRSSNTQVLEYLKAGKSPLSIHRPKGCPEHISAVMESIFKVIPGERPSFTMLKVAFTSFKAYGIEKSKAGNNGEQEQKDDTTTTTSESPTEENTNENKEVIEKNKSDHEGEIEQERNYSKRSRRRERRNTTCQSGQTAAPKAKEIDRKSQQNVEASKKGNQIELKDQNQERQRSVLHQSSSSEADRSRNHGRARGVAKNQPPPKRFDPRPRGGRGSGPSPANSHRPDRDRPQHRPHPPPLMPPPPPPYTPNPLPNHSAVSGHSTPGVSPFGFPQGPPVYCGPPKFDSFGRNPQQATIDLEIRRREEELKMLRTEKLVREINEKQAEVAQLTQKLAEQGLHSTIDNASVGTSAGSSFQGQMRGNERSRGNSSLPKSSYEGHHRRGRGRSGSRGRNNNPSKMSTFPEDKKGNVF